MRTLFVATFTAGLLATSIAGATDASPPAETLFPGKTAPADRDSGTEAAAGGGRFFEHHGWYVAPVVGVTQLDRDAAATYGVRAAWRFNRRFGLGLAVTGMELDRDGERQLDMGYGGLVTEYVLHSNQLVHAVFSNTIGGGAWCRQEEGEDSETGRERDCDGYGFFASEPSANVELNLTSFMRLSVGAGYRFAIASEHDGIGRSELSGFVGRSALEFGRF